MSLDVGDMTHQSYSRSVVRHDVDQVADQYDIIAQASPLALKPSVDVMS